MRKLIIAFLILSLNPGCTYLRLRRSIVNQASTLTELQYQQVLGNLAMMSLDPNALPAHATLRDGSAQIQDVGSLTAGAELTFTSKALPSLTGTRTVVEQWGVVPVTDDIELKLMRIAYRRALGSPETLDDDLANDLAHELCKQISQSDNIDLRSDPTVNTEALKSERIFIDQLSLYDLFLRMSKGEPLPLLPSTKQPLPLPTSNYQGASYEYYYRNFMKNRDMVLRIGQLADALSFVSLDSNDEVIVYPGELSNDLDVNGYFRRLDTGEYLPISSTPVTREARREVKECYKDMNGIKPGWFGVGGKREVPPDACYVGRYKDRYAWVCPGGCKDLADFTLKILDFSTKIKDQTILTVPGGPRFTPSSGGR